MKQENSFMLDQNKYSNIKHVIAVASGKGGVGKSLVTSLLAVALNRMGKKTAILDADITGPSIPKAFGVKGRAVSGPDGVVPMESANGVKIMSVNLLIGSETDPVIWRGPILAATVKQFWSEVVWGDVDYMLVDMPPGTGDVPLTVYQSLPLDGIVVVSTPQDLVSTIVTKAVNMADRMDIPVLGMIENMSYLACPDCGRRIEVFGKSKVEGIAREYGVDNILKCPMDPSIAASCDAGAIEEQDTEWMDSFVKEILSGV